MIAIKFRTFICSVTRNKSVYAAVEQIIFSISNFSIAVFVLKKLGVTQFGIYSALFVFITLAYGLVASVIHGQLVLRIANARTSVRESYFRASFLIYVVLYITAVTCVLLIYGTLVYLENIPDYGTLPFAAALCFGVFSLFELFKRFLYILDNQLRSLAHTATYFVCLVVCLLILWFLQVDETDGLSAVFLMNSFAFSIALIVNTPCWVAIIRGKRLKKLIKIKLVKAFLDQGRFGFLGTIVTWIQNQSVTPILLFFAGATVVGYFNIARLVMMPLMVVNVGLLASVLPQFRRYVKQSNLDLLCIRIKRFSSANLLLCAFYFMSLLGAHATGFFHKMIPEYEKALPFLVVWSVVVPFINYRTWVCQYFIARVKLDYLLYCGIASAVITLGAMIIGFLLTESYFVIAAAVLLGDIYLIIEFKNRIRKERMLFNTHSRVAK